MLIKSLEMKVIYIYATYTNDFYINICPGYDIKDKHKESTLSFFIVLSIINAYGTITLENNSAPINS